MVTRQQPYCCTRAPLLEYENNAYRKRITEAAEHFILAENVDPMGMVRRKSFQYAPPWLENLCL
jgi:hypothetical protein